MTEFCTCTVRDCPHHPRYHGNECNACIQKNLANQEIPYCFFDKIGADKGSDSEYTFRKFAEKVIAHEQ